MKLTLTASSMACALRCPRRYWYDNILGLKEITPSEALRIGTAVHNGGEARAKGLDFEAQYAAAITGGTLDEWMAAKVFGILGAYDRTYGEIEDRDCAAMEPEVEFTDPIDGSRTFEQRGKVDGLAVMRDGRRVVWERKTTSEDVGDTADYWNRLKFNIQLLAYAGWVYHSTGELPVCVYDVIRKPALQPKANIPDLDADGLPIVLDADGNRRIKRDGAPFGNLAAVGEVELNFQTDSQANQQIWVHDPNRQRTGGRKAFVPGGAQTDKAALMAKWGTRAKALFAATPKKVSAPAAPAPDAGTMVPQDGGVKPIPVAAPSRPAARPAAAWRRASHINRETQVYDWRYNLDGLTRAYDATVNPEALLGTRYKYCQYAGGGHCGLMDWLTLYRMEPKVELLAKAGLRRCVCPAGLKALKDRKVFAWVMKNKAMLARSKNWNVRDLMYAARHGITIKKAKEHFETVGELSRKLCSMRWNLRIRNDGWRPVKLKLDYERLAKLLPKWGVDADEYGRYIEHANEAGLDIRNEGTLYPPVTGGRKAFMRRLEELEANAAKMKAAAIDKAMSERAPEIAAFQESVERTKTLHGCGYKIVLAKTQGELLAEGKRMGNCIGNGVYGRGIATGHKLIVMLKLPGVRGGKSFCDIEIDRHTWKVRQCYTKGNRIPPDEVRELANRIATFLKAEHKRHQKRKMFKELERKAS